MNAIHSFVKGYVMEQENKPTTKKTATKKATVKPVEKPVEAVEPVLEGSKTNIEKTVNSKPVMVSEEATKQPKKAKKLSEDVENNRNIAWLAYLLFFIPLLINPNSAFVRHHANEGLEVNIFDFLGITLLLIGALVEATQEWWQLLMIIFTIIGIGLLVLTTVTKIYMIVAALRSKEAVTPWMWNLRIIR